MPKTYVTGRSGLIDSRIDELSLVSRFEIVTLTFEGELEKTASYIREKEQGA